MTLLLALAIADVILLGGWAGAPLSASPWYSLAHAALTVAAFGVLVLDSRAAAAEGRPGWSLWDWNGLSLPLGAVFGPAAILLFILFRPWSLLARRTTQSGMPFEVAVPARYRLHGSQLLTARLLDDRVRFPSAPGVESIATILRHGDLEARCAALQTVVRSFEPRLSPLVAMALADPDQTVRALAAATSAQVSANLADRIARFEAMPAPGVQDRCDFAMLLQDHGCNNVLLSQSQATALRAKAADRLTALLTDPGLQAMRRDAAARALAALQAHRPASSGLAGVPSTAPA